MSTFTASRSGRAATWSVVLTLILVALAPLAVRPPAAAANVCDSLAIGSVCGNDTAVGGVVNGAGNIVGGAASGVAGLVSDGGLWAGRNASGILKAAGAAGIAAGTWVACSRVLKAVTTAGAAAGAGAGTAGAGTIAGGAAGLAASAAVCKLVKKGGQVTLKVAKKGLKTGGKLGTIAKLAAAATGFAALVYGVQHAASWVLLNLLDLDRESAPNLGAKWLTDLRSQLNGTAAVLLLVATILGLTFAGATGRLSDVGRVFTSMIAVALIIGVVGALLLAALQLSDAVTAETMQSSWGQRALGNWTDLGDSYAGVSPGTDSADTGDDAAGDDATGSESGTPQDDGKGPWVIRLLIAALTAFFGALVWLEMMIRDALLYLLLAFGGLLLAGYPFPQTRHLAQRFGMTVLGVVIAKPVIVVTLLVGGSFMQSAAAGQADDGAIVPLLQGAGLMALAGCMGWAILAWFNVHGVGAMAGVGARIRGAAFGGGGGGGGGSRRSTGGDEPNAPNGSNSGNPAGDLARETGDRVDTRAAAATAGAAGAGFGAGQLSGRLQRMRAREATTAAAAAPGAPVGADSGATTRGADRSAAAPSDPLQPTRQTTATAPEPAEAAGGAEPTQADPARSVPDGGGAPAADGFAGAGGTATPFGVQPQGTPPGASAPVPAGRPQTGDASGGGAHGPVPGAATATSDLTAPGPLSGAVPPVPANGAGQIGAPAPPDSAQRAFGAPPPDAIDAFGQHAASVRDVLAANRALGRT